MAPAADDVESIAQMYLRAAENRDHTALWRLMSRGAQAIVIATAKVEGFATVNGPAALQALMNLETGSRPGPGDVAIEVVSRDEDVAQVMVSSASRAESETLPFVREDGLGNSE